MSEFRIVKEYYKGIYKKDSIIYQIEKKYILFGWKAYKFWNRKSSYEFWNQNYEEIVLKIQGLEKRKLVKTEIVYPNNDVKLNKLIEDSK
jgi:hypothetical protein